MGIFPSRFLFFPIAGERLLYTFIFSCRGKRNQVKYKRGQLWVPHRAASADPVFSNLFNTRDGSRRFWICYWRIEKKLRGLHSFFLITEGGSMVTLLKNVTEWSPSPIGNIGVSVIKLFLAGNTLREGGGGVPKQEWKVPENPKIPGREKFDQWHHRIPCWWREPVINVFISFVQYVRGRQRDQWCSSWRKFCSQSVRECPATFPPRATTTTNQSSPAIFNDSRADSKYRKEGGYFGFWNGLFVKMYARISTAPCFWSSLLFVLQSTACIFSLLEKW